MTSWHQSAASSYWMRWAAVLRQLHGEEGREEGAGAVCRGSGNRMEGLLGHAVQVPFWEEDATPITASLMCKRSWPQLLPRKPRDLETRWQRRTAKIEGVFPVYLHSEITFLTQEILTVMLTGKQKVEGTEGLTLFSSHCPFLLTRFCTRFTKPVAAPSKSSESPWVQSQF